MSLHQLGLQDLLLLVLDLQSCQLRDSRDIDLGSFRLPQRAGLLWYLVLELLVLDSQFVDLLLLLLQTLTELLLHPHQLPDAALQLLHLTGRRSCDLCSC